MIPLEKQVTGLELSKRLKELGVKREGCFSGAIVQMAVMKKSFVIMRYYPGSRDEGCGRRFFVPTRL
jgi:hypothetical protein